MEQLLPVIQQELLDFIRDKKLTKYICWEDAVQKCLDSPELSDLARDAYFGNPVDAANRFYNSCEYKELKKIIPSTPKKALDLGAGNGILSWALAKDGWDVTAIEPDSSTLVGAGAIRELVKQTKININVIEAMGEDIPIEAELYDLIVARQVLHHANDLDQFCKEIARLSNPDTIIITLRDHVISNKNQLPDFLNKHPLHNLYGGENAFTLKEYRNAFKNANINIMKEIKSFDSVINYDPMTKNDIIGQILDASGPLRIFVKILINIIPFFIVLRVLSFIDNRPGRLVSFIAKKINI